MNKIEIKILQLQLQYKFVQRGKTVLGGLYIFLLRISYGIKIQKIGWQ